MICNGTLGGESKIWTCFVRLQRFITSKRSALFKMKIPHTQILFSLDWSFKSESSSLSKYIWLYWMWKILNFPFNRTIFQYKSFFANDLNRYCLNDWMIDTIDWSQYFNSIFLQALCCSKLLRLYFLMDYRSVIKTFPSWKMLLISIFYII